MTTIASAPGKLILMGEHAAVYGHPALVAATGLRLTAQFSVAEAPGVELDFPALGRRLQLSWQDILEHARRSREAWERYAADPRPELFAQVCDGDPLHLPKVALGEAADSLGDSSPPPLYLAVQSDLPIGSGLGSSAATAVTLVAGYLAWRGRTGSPLSHSWERWNEKATGGEGTGATLEALVNDVERRQHGTPSGIDAATVLRGGILWARRQKSGGVDLSPLSPAALASPVLARLRVWDTGRPPESTGAVVAWVRERRAGDPRHWDGVLARLGEASAALRRELESDREDPPVLRELLCAAEAGLEELGVVPAPVRELVRRIEAEGGAAKVSGAGSLAGPGAGVLLVYHPEPEHAAAWRFLSELPSYPMRLGGPGLRLEEIG
jgi:mevalonate kinase